MGLEGGRDEVWDLEGMLPQLAKRSPCVVVSGKLQYFSVGTLSRVIKEYQELYKISTISIRAYCHIVICIAMYYHL